MTTSTGRKTIGIQPLGKIESDVVVRLTNALPRPFSQPVREHQPTDDPISAYNPIRRQYLATKVLRFLHQTRMADADKLLGVTNADLYVPDLNFVFGVADSASGIAVISLARLRPEFYGEPPNLDLFLERAEKEALHELGHLFGLGHCDDPRCVMYFSNSIQDTDRKQPVFCSQCGVPGQSSPL